MTTTREAQTIEFLGFANVARRAAGMSDASPANNWNTTKYVWQLVSHSEQEAYDFWMHVYTEDHDEAYELVIEALASCGNTLRDVAHVMS